MSKSYNNISNAQIADGNNIHQEMKIGLEKKEYSKDEIHQELKILLESIKASDLPKKVKSKSEAYLNPSIQFDFDGEQPDVDSISANIEKVKNILDQGANYLDKTSAIGQRILSIGTLLGTSFF